MGELVARASYWVLRQARTKEPTPALGRACGRARGARGGDASQLKEIKAQLKEINTMFRTGTARVTVVINPDRP